MTNDGWFERTEWGSYSVLWVWTLGTAAILIASGVRSSMREMEAMMQSDEKQKQMADRFNGEINGDGQMNLSRTASCSWNYDLL
ncbi:unnamed protein product [Rhodiola kirilowii]